MGNEEESSGKKGIYEGLLIALAMYSRIPVPRAEWTAAGMRYALCFFPLVGAVIGAAVTGFFWLSQRAGLGALARSGIGTAIPLLLTGGIHMDGFLDVTDARSSFQPQEKRLEILKDPHTGAFAILGGGLYLLLYLAAFSELEEGAFPAVAGIYVLERALSGWSVVSFPRARKDGLASTFAKGAKKGTVQTVMLLWGAGASLFLLHQAGPRTGLLAVAAAMLIFVWYYRMARTEFGGVTGDLAGYFLQLCELGMLWVLALML